MAVSGLEPRFYPLERLYLPFGPGGLPAWSQLFGEDSCQASRDFAHRTLRRSRSSAGYCPWRDDDGERASGEELAQDGPTCCPEHLVSRAPRFPKRGGPLTPGPAFVDTSMEGDYEKGPVVPVEAAIPDPHDPSRSPLGVVDTGSQSSLLIPQEEGAFGHTTIMVQNIATNLRRAAFMKKLNALGFASRYDIVHMPMLFGTSQNKGFAFVNFIDEASAEQFFRKLNSAGRPREWRPVPAALQGFDANMRLASGKKASRIRHSRNKPLVLNSRSEATV